MMSGLKLAYGGVIVDTEGRVLLREPSDHFDGYVWTFSKAALSVTRLQRKPRFVRYVRRPVSLPRSSLASLARSLEALPRTSTSLCIQQVEPRCRTKRRPT